MIKKYVIIYMSFLLHSQSFIQALPIDAHKQLFRAILYRVVQTKKEGFPSFEALKNQPHIDRKTYDKLKFKALHDDELRRNPFYLDAIFFHSNKVIKENYYPYQLSDTTIRELQQHIPDFSLGNPEFDQECKYACMYSILGQARRMQETFKADHPKIAFELLAMYPLKELYKPYVKISKIIETHERPWGSFWSGNYSFLYIEE